MGYLQKILKTYITTDYCIIKALFSLKIRNLITGKLEETKISLGSITIITESWQYPKNKS